MGAEASTNGGYDPIKRAERSSALQRVVAEYGHLSWRMEESQHLSKTPEARESVGVTVGMGQQGEGLCVLGGRGTDLAEYNDVHVHDGREWTKCEAEGRPPRPRSGHTAVQVD